MGRCQGKGGEQEEREGRKLGETNPLMGIMAGSNPSPRFS